MPSCEAAVTTPSLWRGRLERPVIPWLREGMTAPLEAAPAPQEHVPQRRADVDLVPIHVIEVVHLRVVGLVRQQGRAEVEGGLGARHGGGLAHAAAEEGVELGRVVGDVAARTGFGCVKEM